MANIKIPKGLLQEGKKALIDRAGHVINYIGQNAPKAMNYVARKSAPVIAAVKDHAVEAGLGLMIGAVGIDDVNQRVKRKEEQLEHEKHEKMAAQQIKKQNAEIVILKDKADMVDEVMEINDQLVNAVKEMKDGGSADEETEE